MTLNRLYQKNKVNENSLNLEMRYDANIFRDISFKFWIINAAVISNDLDINF